MQSVIGALRVVLGMDSAAFEKGLSEAEKRLNGFGKGMTKLGSKLEGIGSQLSLRVTAPIAALGYTSYQAAQESAQAFAQIEAGLKSMGGASGKTAEELQKSAKVLQHISTFDDDEILRGITATMLTFGNVAGEAFDKAQLAALNLSVRLGKDLQSSAVLVGKALNSPVQGLSALSRAGIQFTADQQAMIKGMVEAGNVAGAQAIILGELEKKFGGSAEAARNATPTAEMTEAWNELTEKIGALVIEVLPPLTEALAAVLGWFTNLSPETQKWLLIIGGAAAILGPVLIAIGAVATAIGGVTTAITLAMPVLTALGAFFLANPIGLTLTAIAAAATAVYFAWQNWDKITEIAKRLYEGVKTWIMDKLGAALTWVVTKVKFVSDAFKELYDKVVGHSYVPDLVDGIADEFARLGDVMVRPAQDAAKEVADAFAGISGPNTPKASENLRGAFGEAFSSGLKDVLRGGDLGSVLENFFNRAADAAIDHLFDVVFGGSGAKGGGGILSDIGGIFGGPSIISGIGSLLGFQTGGSFEVGGSGGADSQVMAFRATPGEMVNVTKGGAANNNGPRLTIINNGTPQDYAVKNWTQDEIELIADNRIQKKTPNVVGSEAANPNSPMRRALQKSTNLQRKLA